MVIRVSNYVRGRYLRGYVVYHTRILYRTRMVHTIRVRYVPYAYGMEYSCGTQQL